MQRRVWGIEAGPQRRRGAGLSNPSAWLLAHLAQHGATVGARFTAYYEDLQRLPRHLRRALQRQWRYSLAGIAFVLALGGSPARANVDCNPTVPCGDAAALIDAIGHANDEIELCPGPNTITLGNSCVHTLTTGEYSFHGPTGLPVITSTITIVGLGNGSTITRDSEATFRLFAVLFDGDGAFGNLTLQNLTLSNGLTPHSGGVDGLGGGVFVDHGHLTLTDSTVSGNTAYLGGGLSNWGGTVTVSGSDIIDNTATGAGGGGIYSGKGTYAGNPAPGTGTFTMSNSTVSGNSAGFNGGGLYFYGRTATVTNSTISGNSAGGTGGGVHNDFGATLTLTTSTILGNIASGKGGGVYNYGTLTVTNTSTISGNTASGDGGGVYNAGYAGEYSFSSTLTVTTSTISGNTASRGGGVYNFETSTVIVTNSTITGNSAAFGGGVFNYQGTATLTNSTVVGNRANFGGGIMNVFGSGVVNLIKSTVSGNTATTDGGGVHNYYSSLTLTNSTVSGNTAGSIGGGIMNFGGAATLTHGTLTRNKAVGGSGIHNFGGNLTLARSIISGNTATALGREVFSQDGVETLATVTANNFNLFGFSNNAGIAGFAKGATDIVPTVALSAILNPTLANNGGPTQTHLLVLGSPAIDVVTAACSLQEDQRSLPRPFDGNGVGGAQCDSGSVELQASDFKCNGESVTTTCTVNNQVNRPCLGTAGNDVIRGSTGKDVVVALGGNDQVFGGEGNDVICGGAGNDTLNGEGGNDTLLGEDGLDRVNGGAGTDRCIGFDLRSSCEQS